jgi:pyruvate formate lyase activating enzyme
VISGIKGTSLIDYPGKVAAVIYMSRCNFRCPFCHNSGLVLEKGVEILSDKDVFSMLDLRHGFIDGVVITGGEPTIYSGIEELIGGIKGLGFAVKLDTNGYNPSMLEDLLTRGLIDFVAMDIKTSLEKYHLAAGINIDTPVIIESVELIKNSGIGHEFRTTCVPSLVCDEDIEKVIKLVGRTSHLTLQQFQPENTLDPHYSMVAPYSKEILLDFLRIAQQNVASCRLIGVE